MTFPMASRYADKHDVVVVGYRGATARRGPTAPR